GKRPHAAVEVEDLLGAAQTGKLAHNLQHKLRLRRICLEECQQAEFEGQPAETLVDERTPIQHGNGADLHGIALGCIYGPHQACDSRHLPVKRLRQILTMRKRSRSGDEGHQELTGGAALSYDQMPEKSFMDAGIVTGDAVPSDELPDHAQHRDGPGRWQEAGLKIDNLVPQPSQVQADSVGRLK